MFRPAGLNSEFQYIQLGSTNTLWGYDLVIDQEREMPQEEFDDAIVGAGITGLAHAYHLAMRGRRVIVFERSPLPVGAAGASIRNFGMIWPIGQPAGMMHELARRSRELWLNALQAAGEYDAEITPFNKQEIDELVIRYLDTFFNAPNLQIASRWNGVYVKHPAEPYFMARPAAGVTVITGVGGAGMTLSFGLAEKIVKENLGEY